MGERPEVSGDLSASWRGCFALLDCGGMALVCGLLDWDRMSLRLTSAARPPLTSGLQLVRERHTPDLCFGWS